MIQLSDFHNWMQGELAQLTEDPTEEYSNIKLPKLQREFGIATELNLHMQFDVKKGLTSKPLLLLL